MPGLRKNTMRIVLVLLLFQFIAPAFFSVVASDAEPDNETTSYHLEHNAIVIPMVLREKEETEESWNLSVHIDLTPLIDFTDQCFVLTELHKTKFTPFAFRDRYDDKPPLFTLHGALII